MISDLEAMLLGYEQYRRELDLKIAEIHELIRLRELTARRKYKGRRG